jgi:hypothetical protein
MHFLGQALGGVWLHHGPLEALDGTRRTGHTFQGSNTTGTEMKEHLCMSIMMACVRPTGSVSNVLLADPSISIYPLQRRLIRGAAFAW